MTKWKCVRTNELQHHGIKGMKWGRRRFQNEDGSLTSEGKKRYGSKDYESALKKVKGADDAVKGIKKAKQEADSVAYEKEVRRKVSDMSDKELQQAVNRLNMEERYTQVMTQRNRLEKGKGRVNQILDVAGDTLAATATALGIMVTVTQLLEKKNSK